MWIDILGAALAVLCLLIVAATLRGDDDLPRFPEVTRLGVLRELLQHEDDDDARRRTVTRYGEPDAEKLALRRK